MSAYHVVAVSPADAGDVGESGGALEGLLDGAAAEWIVLAPCVIQSRHARVESRTLRKNVERITPFEELDLNDVRLDCTVCVGGVEATESNDVRVEFGERDDGVEVVVERACRFAPTPSYAVLKVLFALDRVLRSRRAVGKSR